MVAEPLVPNPPPHRFSVTPIAMELDRGTKGFDGKGIDGKGIDGKGNKRKGKAERLEPYEVLTNSPIQKEIVERLRRERPADDNPVPTVHSVATPTAQGLGPAEPPSGIPPQRGCTPDELYSFVMDQLKGVSQEVADMESRVVVRMGITDQAIHDLAVKVDRLEPLQAHAHDLSVFAKIKNFVTQDNLDGKAEAIEGDLNTLKTKLEGFVGQLDGYLTSADNHMERIQAIETQFKRHVEDNFKVVETECAAIRRIIDQVATGDKEAKVSTDAAVQVQLGTLAENVRRLEAKETQGRFDYNTSQAEQVQVNQNFWQQIGKTQAAVTALSNFFGASTGTGSGGHQGAGDPGEGQGATSSTSAGAGAGCNHCWHVDDHERRIAAIEQRVSNPGGDPWWAGAQRAAAPRAAHVPEPPGFSQGPPAMSGALPRAARRAPVSNVDFPDMRPYELNKTFDDKVALSAGFSYDGEKHGEAWKRKVRGYWISKCPHVLPMLKYVEDLDTEEITPEHLKAEARSYMWMKEDDVQRLNEILWGFLNTCLSGKARTCFEGADMCNGFDAWRRVVQQIHQGANVRLGTLRRLVKSPPQIAKLEDIDAGIVRFEGIMKDYRAAGGVPPEGAELKNDLLETLPHEIREQLMWRATEVDHETFGQFAGHVRNTANSILFHRGKTTSSLNSVAEPGPTEEESYEDAIMAVNKKFNRSGGGPGPRRPPAPGGGDRPPRALKCLNCGDEEHLTIKCPRPRVEAGQRPCFGCGKKGHIARNCPDRTGSGGRGGNNKAVRNVDEHEKEEQDYTFCVSYPDEDGFTTAAPRRGHVPTAPGRAAARRPMPMARTLGAFVPTAPPKKSIGLTNSFKALSCKEPQCTDSACTATARTTTSMDALASLPFISTSTGKQGRPGYHRADVQLLSRPAPEKVKTVAQIMKENEELLNGLESIDIEDDCVAPVFEEEATGGEEVFAAAEMRMSVAADTGAVAHCAGPKDLPDTAKVDQTHQRNLVDASGNRLKHFGRTKVRLRHANGKNTTNDFEVMNVCRPLHSVSMITDNKFDMLFTKTKGIVVPAGAFDEVIATIKDRIIAEYPRKGGLYVTEVVVTDPDVKKLDSGRPATFAGPGASQ